MTPNLSIQTPEGANMEHHGSVATPGRTEGDSLFLLPPFQVIGRLLGEGHCLVLSPFGGNDLVPLRIHSDPLANVEASEMPGLVPIIFLLPRIFFLLICVTFLHFPA
jgi:hypothetical protein